MPSRPPLPPRQMSFSPREVARTAGLHVQTVYRHHREGLAIFDRLPSGSLRMTRANLIAYLGGNPAMLSDEPPPFEPWWPVDVDVVLM